MQRLDAAHSPVLRLLWSRGVADLGPGRSPQREVGAGQEHPVGAGLGSTMTNEETLSSRHVWGGGESIMGGDSLAQFQVIGFTRKSPSYCLLNIGCRYKTYPT